MPELYLGVDAGQTVIKAAVFEAAGRQQSVSSAPTATTSPHPRWQERDMDVLWDGVVTAVRGALAGVDADAIAAVGLCGHGDGAHLIDAEGRPVRPAILATDSRAYVEADRGAAGPELLELTGQKPAAFASDALLRWLSRYEPDTLARAATLLYCKDWIRYRLTGALGTDRTDAGAAFADVQTGAWSPRAAELSGLPDVTRLLPAIGDSAAVAGTVTADAAAATGLPPGTPVVFGAHDVHAAALGMGAVADEAVSVIMGTFSINQVVADHVEVDDRWQARPFLVPGRWLHMSTSPSSASNLDWAVREFGAGGVETAGAAAFAVPTDRPPPVFLPLLFGGPFGDDVEAGLVGLRGWHTRADVLRSVFEGVVYTHRWHLEALAEKLPFGAAPMRLGGGGSNSPAWCQLLADATGLALEVTDTSQTGARGAALLAAVGVGRFASVSDAAAVTGVIRRHVPDPARRRQLDAGYARYRAAVQALTTFGA